MEKYMNARDYRETLPEYPVEDGGRAYLEEKLRAIAIEKYHPKIEKLCNQGRREELIALKKQLEIDFFNDSTQVYEEYQEMLA